MSGETEANISAWTNDTVLIHLGKLVDERTEMLRALIDGNDRLAVERAMALGQLMAARESQHAQQFEEKDVRDQQRFDAQQLALRDALLAQEKAVSAALEAAQQAVLKAEGAAEKRFENMNEFRGQLADQAATLMPRQEMQVLVDAINEKIGIIIETYVTRDVYNTAHVDLVHRVDSTVESINAQNVRLTGMAAGTKGEQAGGDRTVTLIFGVITAVALIASVVVAIIATR